MLINNEKYKGQDQLIKETILMLRRIITGGGLTINTAGLATETTLDLIKTAVDLLATTVNGDNINTSVNFKKDGINTIVNEDTVTPSNNTPLPVKITGTTGDINITAGDLNVQLSSTGTNYDSVRIGDGTNLLTINSDGSINANVITEDVLNKYAISRSDTTTNIEYYGFVDKNGKWYILKIDTINGTYLYSNGDTDFLTNWGSRSTLTYDEFQNLTW